MINKQKMAKSARGSDSQMGGQGAGRSGGGPDNYDGRANTNAGTPEPQAREADGPGFQVKTDE